MQQVILDPTGAPVAHVSGHVKIVNPLYKIQTFHPKGAVVQFPSQIPVAAHMHASHGAHAAAAQPVGKETSMMGDLSEMSSLF